MIFSNLIRSPDLTSEQRISMPSDVLRPACVTSVWQQNSTSNNVV